MLTRLAPLALVMIAACTTAPESEKPVADPVANPGSPVAAQSKGNAEMAKSRMTGTWERRVAFSPEFGAPKEEAKASAREFLYSEDTFKADGTCERMLWGNDERKVRPDGVVYSPIAFTTGTGSWRVIGDEPGQITVECTYPHKSYSGVQAFEVVGLAELRGEDQFGPFRMIRIWP